MVQKLQEDANVPSPAVRDNTRSNIAKVTLPCEKQNVLRYTTQSFFLVGCVALEVDFDYGDASSTLLSSMKWNTG